MKTQRGLNKIEQRKPSYCLTITCYLHNIRLDEMFKGSRVLSESLEHGRTWVQRENLENLFPHE